MTELLLAHFQKRYSRDVVIEAALELPIRGSSTTVLFGPSGCGKTTILRALAGLVRPELGKIAFGPELWFDRELAVYRSPQERGIGFCFQEYALFPHLTIHQNVGYGLRLAARQRTQAISEMLSRFQLAGLAQRYPRQISGGQQQRVALARALIRQPKLLLLDEPLAALDANLRDELRTELRQLLAAFEIPVVLVTHDRLEAISLADAVVLLDRGRVVQCGPTAAVMNQPMNAAAARIVGIENVLSAKLRNESQAITTVDVQGITLGGTASRPLSQDVEICFRAEDVCIQTGELTAHAAQNSLRGTVTWLTSEGALTRVGLDCGIPMTALVPKRELAALQLQVGSSVRATIEPRYVHVMPGSPSMDKSKS